MALTTFDLIQSNGVNLVFGMEWFPLLGEPLQRQALALSRRRKASHRVLTAAGAASVGLVKLQHAQRGKSRICSAAAVFAGLHPTGTVAAILPLPGGNVWLVAVHEGAVITRSDQLHDSPEAVQDIVHLLQEAHPGLRVHDERLSPSGLLETLFEAAREHGELQKTRPRLWRAPLAVSMVALIFLWASWGQQGWPGAQGNIDVMPETNAVELWKDALSLAAAQHKVHGVAGLGAVLNAFYEMPVYLAGWMLHRAECLSHENQWNCRASYRREPTGDNQSLIDAARPEWLLSFDPMEGAVAAWSLAMPALSLSDVLLKPPRHNETRLVSALQAILPAFTTFRLETSQPLPVVAPLDAQQQVIPRPAEVSAYRRRGLHVQAPLRSLSLLLPETQHMSWEKVQLEVLRTDQPSLRSSSLNVSLLGGLYEIDDPVPVLVSSAPGAVGGERLIGGSR